MNKLKLHIWSQWGVLVLVGLLAVGYLAVAYTNNSNGQPTTVIENAGGVTINNPEQSFTPEELGGGFSPTNLPFLMCSGDACTHTATFDLADATTTIASIATPFLAATSSATDVVLSYDTTAFGWTGATTTVDLVRINITGVATSSFKVYCGSAATSSATSTASYNILTSDTIATSTKGVIENDLASTYNLGIGGGSVSKIMLTPTLPYLVCKVYTTAGTGGSLETPSVRAVLDGAFTETTNTFDGKITVRFSKIR